MTWRRALTNERREAVTQTEIDTANGRVHELQSVLRKQEDILASGGGTAADQAKCAASIGWIQNEFRRVDLLKAGMRVPEADRSAYGYRACDGIRKIR